MPKKDVDLGSGVFIGWTSYNGARCGGILIHPISKEINPDTGECSGAFWFKDNEFLRGENRTESERKRPVWEFNGDFENPTLSPSFLCHCGFHGFIKEGKWVPA